MAAHPQHRPRRRRGRFIGLLVLFALLAGGWSWLWNYAAGKADEMIAGWRQREAKVGRIHSCFSQTIGGYPFRIEVNCDRMTVLLRSNQPPLEVKTSKLLVAAQIYDPTLLISEFTGPLTVAEPGQPPLFAADWQLAQSSVRGTPNAPERVSIVFNRPTLDRFNDGRRENVLRARHLEIHGRLADGSAASRPVIEMVLRLNETSAPGIHPLALQPIDADITAVLRGLNDFSPKPWPARFREMQAAGGRIDITQARVQQGQTIAVGTGALALNARGRLEGQLRVTVAGLEPFLKAIGADRIAQSSAGVDRVAGALDRFMPGLGNVAREQAGANISLGINLLGEQATLEGKRAVTLPLRFQDGAVMLGPVPIGTVQALF